MPGPNIFHMNKFCFAFVLSLLLSPGSYAQKRNNIVTADIDNFWRAYDKVRTTADSAQQVAYLDELFISKGSPGLKAMMKLKGYTSKSYTDLINKYPAYWNSIRENTLKVKKFSKDIAVNVGKLKKLYPDLKPATIYFTIGALRSGGTTVDSMILIGSEIALADRNTVTTEFTKGLENLRTYFKSDPINIVVFTNIHEYIHTQQKTTDAATLLGQSLLEGVAEFVAVKATAIQSTLPSILYGKEHEEQVRQAFAWEMFNPFTGFWLYSDARNKFNVRDLGYYVGYAICEKYYNQSDDKSAAIREMIELDYNNEDALSAFVDKSRYFDKPVQLLKSEYERSRPVVVAIKPFGNNSQNVDPATTQLTIEFSAPMDDGYRSFGLGPLGEKSIFKLKRVIGYSDDRRSLTLEIELEPGRHYQKTVNAYFRSKEGISLKPFLIDFTTADKL